MTPIKVELYIHDNFACGRVLEMPEEIREKGLIIESGIYRIKSVSCPSLEKYELYLRGRSREHDNVWFFYNFETELEAERAVANYRDMIHRWNIEHKDILNEREKSYLSAVIKPFRDKSWYIVKTEFDADYEQIVCVISSDVPQIETAGISFPCFKKGKMYKGMEENKKYKLKELGLE